MIHVPPYSDGTDDIINDDVNHVLFINNKAGHILQWNIPALFLFLIDFFYAYYISCSFFTTNSSINRTVSSTPKEEESTHK